LCAELGVRCLVANTASEAWKFERAKRKTDRDDAAQLDDKTRVNLLIPLRPTAGVRRPTPTPVLPSPLVGEGKGVREERTR
jgi:hypothetical protein